MLAGKVVVFSGTLSMKRAVAQQMAIDSGATVTTTVTSATNVIVIGSCPGGKVAAAAAKGVEEWTEHDFRQRMTREDHARRVNNNNARRIDDTTEAGKFQFSLSWDDAVDLDINLWTPQGRIWFQRRKLAGAELDVDRIPKPHVDLDENGDWIVRPIENIVCDRAFPGDYICRVKYYVGDKRNVDYTVHCRVADVDYLHIATLVKEDDEHIAFAFTVGEDGKVSETYKGGMTSWQQLSRMLRSVSPEVRRMINDVLQGVSHAWSAVSDASRAITMAGVTNFVTQAVEILNHAAGGVSSAGRALTDATRAITVAGVVSNVGGASTALAQGIRDAVHGFHAMLADVARAITAAAGSLSTAVRSITLAGVNDGVREIRAEALRLLADTLSGITAARHGIAAAGTAVVDSIRRVSVAGVARHTVAGVAKLVGDVRHAAVMLLTFPQRHAAARRANKIGYKQMLEFAGAKRTKKKVAKKAVGHAAGKKIAARSATRHADGAVVSLDGEVIVFTGTLSVKRSVAESRARAAGATTASGITGFTTIVVAGAGAGAKLEAAKGLGTTIISEEEFERRCA
jgi:hypothetical protein